MSDTSNHGGAREGAGRPKGGINRRSLEAIRDVADRFPDWSPLMHFATVANDETLDVSIRLDAAKAAAPYIHPKLKSTISEPDELVELETRITRARVAAQVEIFNEQPGLGDRLLRAMAAAEAAGILPSR